MSNNIWNLIPSEASADTINCLQDWITISVLDKRNDNLLQQCPLLLLNIRSYVSTSRLNFSFVITHLSKLFLTVFHIQFFNWRSIYCDILNIVYNVLFLDSSKTTGTYCIFAGNVELLKLKLFYSHNYECSFFFVRQNQQITALFYSTHFQRFLFCFGFFNN